MVAEGSPNLGEDPVYEDGGEEQEEVMDHGVEAGERSSDQADQADRQHTQTPPLATATAAESASPAAKRKGGGVLFAAEASHTPSEPRRVPAAGAGTRTGPRPVPRSSSSLRHVQSKTRTTSFGIPVPEDRDPSELSSPADPSASTVARHVDYQRRKSVPFTVDETFDESDADEHSDGAHDDGQRGDYFSRHTSSLRKSSAEPAIKSSSQLDHYSSLDDQSDETDLEFDFADLQGQPSSTPRTYQSSQLSAPDARQHATKPARSPGSLLPPLDSTSASTPGPVFPNELHTPMELTPGELPVINVQHRMEWQTMLASVLNSEVLKSETKRINSVDTPDLTRSELSHQRWLDIRATLRGRGLHRGAIEEEQKRLNEGWAKMLRELIEEIKQFRHEHIEAAKRQAEPPASPNDARSVRSEALTSSGEDDARDAVPANNTAAPNDVEKEKVLEEVGSLLERIDSAEEQFPSSRKAKEVVPEWADEEVQSKLDALISWYSTTTSLQQQIGILRKWTGSDTLQISEHRHRSADTSTEDATGGDNAGEHPSGDSQPDIDDSTFVERIQKEGSLQSTFETRTLSSLYQLITKAKTTILEYHDAFRRMALPSFEPELVTLINFPTRLMQGALKLRLDYAGKLSEPSVLIVDSLTDDVRTALAMACRVKLQYTKIIGPDPARGWDLAPCIAEGYDEVLRDALKFFFRLLRMKLRASVFFKETEILEPEWRFLSTAVESIEGGDTIVASNITQFVNRLFKRISRYFNRELTAAFSKSDEIAKRMPNPATGPVGLASADQSAGRGLAKGKNLVSLEDRARWIHSVFDNVRIRSRKLLGFARDIRNRLDNAAEYDLGSLQPAVENAESASSLSHEESDGALHGLMGLAEFMQTLIDHDYFLVYTESLEEKGIYLIAEPSLQDKPELIREMLCKCLHRVRPSDEDTAMAADANANALNPDAEEGDEVLPMASSREHVEQAGPTVGDDEERPRYLLLLSPRDPFMWTGKVMHHVMPRVDIALADRRLRLVADGPKGRLELCKRHFQAIFSPELQGINGKAEDATDDGSSSFPLETLNDHMAHMSRIQCGLEDINKGVYLLSDTIIRKVPEIRRRLRGLSAKQNRKQTPKSTTAENMNVSSSGDCDELIQNSYSMATEQGRRALPFIESVRLRNQMTLALTRLAIDWVAFICDDCVPSDRKTFKWAVTALGNANYITSSENILRLTEADFALLRSKVASCMALLISHFDILGARSSVAKAQAEQERLEKEQAERKRLVASNQAISDDLHQVLDYGADRTGRALLKLGPGIGAQHRFNKLDAVMHATEERWVLKVREWDQARQELESEQRVIGRVLDDTRLEDRSLQFLAQSASKVTIRWQQGQFIGGGTFGTVYLAVNLDSGGLMAVKEIRFQDISSTPGLYKQIKDEMHVMSMLSHPNIVEYYGLEVHRDRVYIFEEYCQGGSLAALLEHGRIEDETVIQVYTLQMLDGLVYLHSKGIVHRDIKPDNILLDHMGVIKFVDFGAAKVLAKNSRTIQRSRRPGIVGPGGLGGAGMIGPDGKPVGAAAAMQSLQGTPMYMSPEVIKGENRGRRGAMDIWSLGCVVLEFATGRRPWSQLDNEWAIMFHIGMAQQHPPLPDPSQLSELGIDFIRSCLSIDPYDRPSAAEMREHPWIKNFVDELNAANEAESESRCITAVRAHLSPWGKGPTQRSDFSMRTERLELTVLSTHLIALST
ncbi:Suppressor of Sensor Kinase (SLN1) [Thecaphora frezii]